MYCTLFSETQLILTLANEAHQLLENHSQVCKVLNLLSDKIIKDGNEPFSFKLHYLCYVIKECVSTTSTDALLKRLERVIVYCNEVLTV